MTNHESDDEELTLSASTLDALKAFYAERDARAEQFAKLQAEAEERHAAGQAKPLSMDVFTEDWNKSQFWYAEETASLLARQLLDGATAETTIAAVSAPSVFVAMKNILNAAPSDEPKPKLVLLEHDNRFAIFPEFVFYDYAQPLKLPSHLKGTCDRIICDPPFLNEDCQTKAALTVRWLAKPSPPSPSQLQLQPQPQPQPAPSSSSSSPSSSDDAAHQHQQQQHQQHHHQQEQQQQYQPTTKLIVCTGERMEPLVTRLYRALGLRTTDYEPRHAGGLSNEFYCYANFVAADGCWGWRVR
ncbi:cd3cdb60-8906-4b92-ba3e-48abd6aa44b3 [Thermothielavioides terrestris]|uniref:Protein-lysine N-methyltransferase EFM5 n=1 Tax=Thermothielavioides terrestris TaxID=2587410 RepID=A0A3S4ATS3_9PEZI|nr:cd3cdb60-8906-4b92-ba3e-48abd6aa44b3 [Thermothielavioides terrestris]